MVPAAVHAQVSQSTALVSARARSVDKIIKTYLVHSAALGARNTVPPSPQSGGVDLHSRWDRPDTSTARQNERPTGSMDTDASDGHS